MATTPVNKASENPKPKPPLNGLFQIVLVLLCIASVLSLGANFFWPLFFIDQMRVHFTLCLLLGFLGILRRKRHLLSLLLLSCLALNGYLLWPNISGTFRPGRPGMLSVLHVNLDKQTKPSETLRAFVELKKPAILMLQEVTPEFASSNKFPRYRIAVQLPREDTRGVMALVRDERRDVQIESAKLFYVRRKITDRPMPHLTLNVNGRRLSVLSFHTARPRNAETMKTGQIEYDGLSDWFHDREDAAIAIGDFNATSWCQRVRTLIREAELPELQQGFSLSGTWPSTLGPVGIPIDLVLHNDSVREVSIEVGPSVASDHLPLYCEVTW